MKKKSIRSLGSLLVVAIGLPFTAWATFTPTVEQPKPSEHASADRTHPIKGVIVEVVSEEHALLVKHEDIPGVMRAMTMLFKVEPEVLKRVKAGDAVKAQLSKRMDGWWLSELEVLPANQAGNPSRGRD